MESGRTTRRYASSIAIVSGLYSLWSAGSTMVGSPMMPEGDGGVGIGTTIMAALGVVVLLHGILLETISHRDPELTDGRPDYNGRNLVVGTASASGSNLTAEADSRMRPSVDARPVELT